MTPHTLEEFAPYKRDRACKHWLTPIGYWHPTPAFHKYMLDLVSDTRISEERRQADRRELDMLEALPMPRASSNRLSQDDTTALIAYMESTVHFRATWCGSSTCRLCGALCGDSDLDDGVYLWPSGLVHYVRDHGVGLPGAFIAHALSGGRPPIVSTASGWCHITHRDTSESMCQRRVPEDVLYTSPEEIREHINQCFESTDGPIWDYWAVPVECVVTNGRITDVREVGPHQLVVKGSA